MAIENLTSIILPEDMIKDVSHLVWLFQALGGLVIGYIVFNVIGLILGRKKQQDVRKIRVLLEKINRKLDKKK